MRDPWARSIPCHANPWGSGAAASSMRAAAWRGVDPLGGFRPHTAQLLRRLASFANAGDIIVNGAYDPSTGHVIGLDDLVGAHGGAGGMQTQPFLVYPAAWTERAPEPPDLVGAAAVHQFLRRHTVDQAADPPAAATAGAALSGEDDTP